MRNVARTKGAFQLGDTKITNCFGFSSYFASISGSTISAWTEVQDDCLVGDNSAYLALIGWLAID